MQIKIKLEVEEQEIHNFECYYEYKWINYWSSCIVILGYFICFYINSYIWISKIMWGLIILPLQSLFESLHSYFFQAVLHGFNLQQPHSHCTTFTRGWSSEHWFSALSLSFLPDHTEADWLVFQYVVLFLFFSFLE